MSDFVLDNSVIMSWFFKEEKSKLSEEVLNLLNTQQAHVPSLWVYELSNTLFIAEKRKNYSASESMQFVKRIAQLPIYVQQHESFEFIHRILPFCRKYALTAYDAAYLDLALTQKFP